MQRKKVIAVVGPTASGKSSLGIYLARKVGGEILSADSRQVYRGLDIGTGKVTKKETQGVPHHLLDVADPKKIYSASDFLERARRDVPTILKKKRVPIIVGGTGFYIDALLGRMVFPDVAPNPALRTRLEKKTAEALLRTLQMKDPARAATIEKGNKRRLIRALEIASALGRSPKGGPALTGTGAYEVLWLGISLPERTLHKNIHDRLRARIRRGMIAEAQRLHARGLSYKRMRELGLEYRYLADYLEEKISRPQFEEQLERAIRQYAKRQMRWFVRNKDIRWINNKTEALRLAKTFLSR